MCAPSARLAAGVKMMVEATVVYLVLYMSECGCGPLFGSLRCDSSVSASSIEVGSGLSCFGRPWFIDRDACLSTSTARINVTLYTVHFGFSESMSTN